MSSNISRKIRKFKNDLLHYQEAVADTILIINTIDNFESFYAYVIFSYYLYLTNRIFNKYNIGIGIFNSQRFERRNKESKSVAKKSIMKNIIFVSKY